MTGRGVGLLLAWVLSMLTLGLPSALASDCDSGAGTGSEGVGVRITCTEAPHTDVAQTVGDQLGHDTVTYSYDPVCIRGEGIQGDGFYGCGSQQKCGKKGHMFYVWAHYAGGGSENLGAQCFDQDEAPAAPTPQVTQGLVLRAFQRIPVPASRVSIQPPGGKTLVNLETIFSTEAAEFTRTIGLLGHRVDLEISPSRFEWVTGDGEISRSTRCPRRPIVRVISAASVEKMVSRLTSVLPPGGWISNREAGTGIRWKARSTMACVTCRSGATGAWSDSKHCSPRYCSPPAGSCAQTWNSFPLSSFPHLICPSQP